MRQYSILMKPGQLTKEEFETLKIHTTTGVRILANYKAEVPKIAEQIAASHHGKLNVKGIQRALPVILFPWQPGLLAWWMQRKMFD